MVEGDGGVAEGVGEGERLGEAVRGGGGRPGEVEVVEHGWQRERGGVGEWESKRVLMYAS